MTIFRPHPGLIVNLVVSLALFGLLLVGDASVVTAARDFGDKWYYLKLQSTWAVFGLVAFLVSSRIPLARIEKLATPFFLTCLLLLVAVLIPGIGSKILGARRWINLGILSFQPAELAKLATAVYLSRLFTHPRFHHLLLISCVLGSLIMLEPDMGTALVILGMIFLVYVGSGGPLIPLVLASPAVTVLLAGLIFISPYRTARLKTFFDSTHDPLGASYQIRQSLIGIGSGGIWGIGLGQSRQKYEFLPEVTTDSVFAVVGEELGLAGTLALTVAYLTLTLTGLELAKLSSSGFHTNLAVSLSSWFGLQAFINMSALVALLPFTGIPLPFISYGGSSLLVTLIGSGLLVNLSRSSKKI